MSDQPTPQPPNVNAATFAPPVPTPPWGGPAEPPPPAPLPGRDPQDPGSSKLVKWAWAVLLLAVLLVVGMHQLGGDKPAAAAAPQPIVAPGSDDPFTMTSKMMVRIANLGLPMQPGDAQRLTEQVTVAARAPVEHLRAAVVVAEIQGPEDALKKLDTLELPDDLKADAELFRIAFDDPSALDTDQRTTLEERHGWFGKLALSRGKDNSDPARAELVGGGAVLMTLLLLACCMVVVWVIGGMIACGIMIYQIAMRRLRTAFAAPMPGGSVYLETAAVFVVGFILLQVVQGVAAMLAAGKSGEMPGWFLTFSLLSQWALVLCMFWPLCRGVPWSRFRQDIGWHSGRGVFREIFAGIYGYFAAVPLIGAAVVVTLVIVLIRQAILEAMGRPAEPPSNPIAELIGKAGAFQLALLFLLATCWAPLVEETIFRGALFRHMRSRMALWLSAALSGLIFGVMHGYDVLMLGPVIVIGFVMGYLREWRGSLIACITAHFVHNAAILTLAISVFSVMKD